MPTTYEQTTDRLRELIVNLPNYELAATYAPTLAAALLTVEQARNEAQQAEAPPAE